VSTRKIKTTRWAVGINTIIGGEWFAAKNISLLAEYAVRAVYDWQSGTETRVIENTREVIMTDMKRLIFDAQSVRFGVSLYF
jgi:hypothetical protein